MRTARSTWEAMDILTQESFDAAVMDVKIPGETSTPALYDWIEHNRPELAPRVIFTASTRQDVDAIELPSRFGCPLLTKPFRVDEFLHAFEKVVAKEESSSLNH